MDKRLLVAAALGVVAGAASAANPTGVVNSSSIPGVTFAQYAGAGPLGQGAVDANTLFFVDEQTGALGKSWYVFYDPEFAAGLTATITFDSTITGVFSTKSALDGSNAAYGAPGVTYGTHTYIGLEPSDVYAFSGNTLTIHWISADPGDHIRVFTSPVPEPTTAALLAAGLLAVGFAARRRAPRR